MKCLLGFRDADPWLIDEDMEAEQVTLGLCVWGGPGGIVWFWLCSSPLGSASLLSLCVLQKMESSWMRLGNAATVQWASGEIGNSRLVAEGKKSQPLIHGQENQWMGKTHSAVTGGNVWVVHPLSRVRSRESTIMLVENSALLLTSGTRPGR